MVYWTIVSLAAHENLLALKSHKTWENATHSWFVFVPPFLPWISAKRVCVFVCVHTHIPHSIFREGMSHSSFEREVKVIHPALCTCWKLLAGTSSLLFKMLTETGFQPTDPMSHWKLCFWLNQISIHKEVGVAAYKQLSQKQPFFFPRELEFCRISNSPS